MSIDLWAREGRNLRLTKAGVLLLQTAQQLLPILEQTEKTLKAYAQGRQGILRIGVECYPCYEWLRLALKNYQVGRKGAVLGETVCFINCDGLMW